MSNIIDSIQLSGVTYTIQGSGGGKVIEAGRGISVTTGETADTVSFNLPISAGTGLGCIVEGSDTVANGEFSHAEGEGTTATSFDTHAEGYYTLAKGNFSHAEGNRTTASGGSSHAEGYSTQANGVSSHAEGEGTITNNQSEHASGKYNVSNTGSTDADKTLFSVGNGTADNARHNAFEIRQNGDIYITSGVTNIKLQDNLGGGNPTVELTQAEYDALVTAGTVSPTTYYIITDAQAGDLTQYWTSAQTQSAITQATSGKVDTSTYNTYTAATDTALANKQTTLTAGTGISIVDNVISAEGGGGGGKAVSGGTNISITTGETADTINCTIPVSADTNNSMGVITNYEGNNAGHMSFAGGYIAKAKKDYSFAFGIGAETNYYYSTAIGQYTKTTCWGETAFGCYNKSVSASTSFDGNSGNTLFSVGNGTADNARHNAFEIRQNGDIYLSSGGTDIKLQDHLGGGGGGSSYSAGTGIDITNDVISVTGKVDTSTYNTYTAATDTALASKQTTLTAGTGINITDNVISATGGGGGGKAVSGGTNISITTGETADTINCTLPIREGSNSSGKGIIVGDSECTASGLYGISLGHSSDAIGAYSFCNGSNSYARGQMSFAHGDGCDAKHDYAFMIGDRNISTKSHQYSFGYNVKPKNVLEFGFGTYNNSSSASTTFGHSGNTMFSIGNGYDFSSTHNWHNAFEVRQNGDIYVPNTDDTSVTGDKAYSLYPMVRLQDTITATAANTTALGGLKLVKLTQSEYDNLSTKDNSTLYVIVN